MGVVVVMGFDRYPILYESYAKGPEMAVTAKKMTTYLLSTLSRKIDTTLETIVGEEVPVGTVAIIGATLYDETDKTVPNKPIDIYHRLGTGAYSKIGTQTTDAYGHIGMNYTLAEMGIHTFYCQFPGDAQYEGCAKSSFAKSR